MKSYFIFQALLVLFIINGLTACGQSGKLYLPQDNVEAGNI